MVEPKKTKERILQAAAVLFDAKGFNGTTVRQIAEAAGVNLALISYYFQGKQGLLESLLTEYFEKFFQILSKEEATNQGAHPSYRLEQMVRLYVLYQQEHAAVTRVVQRELSVESMLAREVMTLYIHRWKHHFATVIEEGIELGEFRNVPIDPLLLSMSSLLIYPYLNPQSVREVYYLEPGSVEFSEWLTSATIQLLRSLLMSSENVRESC
ncbi:forespore capture DNA-binding protein RefZ [Brevibacillus dissolubilis]|uniref:forespore capture DNA-binding protein RefZ n=1 Tax=Brevibacillus dissolubilis TaxID=1844116 RepID=UPI0011174CA8|nr:forespore capture DNA-binding protein RefZ [Brevibacillus dissolubilis]